MYFPPLVLVNVFLSYICIQAGLVRSSACTRRLNYEGSIRFCGIHQRDKFRTALFRHPSFPGTEKRVKLQALFGSDGQQLLFFNSPLLSYERIWDREMGYSAILSRNPDTASYRGQAAYTVAVEGLLQQQNTGEAHRKMTHQRLF